MTIDRSGIRLRSSVWTAMIPFLLMAGPALAQTKTSTPPRQRATADDERPKAIYGNDDRLDEYQISNSSILERGDGTVGLISRSDLINNGDGTYTLSTISYALDQDLCPGERFADQPTAPYCSGFLADDDIVVTAGHCVVDSFECVNTAIVFDFVMEAASSPVVTLDESDVYFCSEILARRSDFVDWGVIRLDRPVVGHSPLPYRTAGTVPDNEPLLVIGHPGGLPRKYDSGGRVRENSQANEFEANIDTFVGNSGSPILSANTLMVEGILVAGETDFTYVGPPNDCYISARFSDFGGSGESATRITALPDLANFADAPSTPKRMSNPESLDFGNNLDTLTFEAFLTASGSWTFDVVPRQSWLRVQPTRGSSTGPADTQTVTVTVDRTGLAAGQYDGQIDMDEVSVTVQMTVGGSDSSSPNGTAPCGPVGAAPALMAGVAFMVTVVRRRQAHTSGRTYGLR